MHLRRYYAARSARARKMAAARWAKHRARREEGEAERLLELAAHPPICEGDAIARLEFHDFRSGEVRRWVVKATRDPRRVTLETPDGRTTKAHGWTWHLDKLRGHLAGTKP